MDKTTLRNDWLGSRLKTIHITIFNQSVMWKMIGNFTTRAVQKAKFT